MNGYIGNYGWSIIALTVIINLVMFPLRHKSVVSMRKMQEIQPEVKAIQDRYAKLKMNDPARQKMNVELMNLYRERGVNPASGCVPMLLTHAGAVRVLRDAVGGDRIARRAVHRLDQGSVDLRSVVRHADPDGRHAVRPAADDAGDRRSRAAADHDVHAADLHDDVHLGAERPGALLDGEQPVGDRPAGHYQSHDRSVGRSAWFGRRRSGG